MHHLIPLPEWLAVPHRGASPPRKTVPSSSQPRPICIDGFARDARVCALLVTHPVTTGLLVQIGLFPNRQRALKRLRLLAERHHIRVVGSVSMSTGGQELVFCRWKPRPARLAHEVALSEVLLRLNLGTVYRGPDMARKNSSADAEVSIGGERYWLVMDQRAMWEESMWRRLRRYELSSQRSLWVCGTAQNMERLCEQAERLRQSKGRTWALYTTHREALAHPDGPVWRDCRGRCGLLRDLAGRVGRPEPDHRSVSAPPRSEIDASRRLTELQRARPRIDTPERPR
jgi:hypothetical protein